MQCERTVTLLTTVSNSTTEYTDNSVTLHDAEIDSPEECTSTEITYTYKIIAKDTRGMRSLKSEKGIVTGYEVECHEEGNGPGYRGALNDLPEKFSVNNFPNPFNPETKINYESPNDVLVKIIIYDALGREVKILLNEFKIAGRYNVAFKGNDLPSGVYYYRFSAEGEAGNFMQTKKMLLLK